MGAYDRDYWKEPKSRQRNPEYVRKLCQGETKKRYATEYSPRIKDYLKWMIIPALLGAITFGIGSLILMIVWACDSNDIPRANYFRAQFIITGIGIAIGIIFIISFSFALADIGNNIRYQFS